MNQDRIEGAAKILGGRVKDFVGQLFRHSKIQVEGKLDHRAGGKTQNTVGGLKDTLRGNEQRRRL